MDFGRETLLKMEFQRDQRYPVAETFITAELFYERLQVNKECFAEKYAKKSWKEWSWADSKAMKYLKRKK